MSTPSGVSLSVPEATIARLEIISDCTMSPPRVRKRTFDLPEG